MLSVTDPAQLSHNLDLFPVPMFVAERPEQGHYFRMICVNAALSRASHLSTPQIAGARPCDYLTPDDARSTEDRFEQCARLNSVINYRETLTLRGRRTNWDTTLMPVAMPDGQQRLVGTSLPIHASDEQTAMTDAEYYAAQAQMQIGQIQEFLEILRNQADVPIMVADRAMMAGGLTRSIDQTLMDLRLSLRGRPGPHAGQRPRLVAVPPH